MTVVNMSVLNKKYRQIVALDFETFFSKTYSLKSKDLNTSEYIRHPEFKVQCVGIKLGEQPVCWYRDRDVEAALRAIDWRTTALLAHHAAFDGLVLSHHYGIVPAYYLDTLSMARALHSNALGASLDTVARFYQLGNKLPDVLDKTKGVRELDDELMTALGQYCAVDVELCRMIFDKMIEGFPQDELDLIDMTVRMFCDPVLELDLLRVQKALDDEIEAKNAKITAAGVPLEVLSSSDKFAAALQEAGVNPPTKISQRTGKTAWAFSKSDLDFTALLEHPEMQVRRLVQARLAAKSTIGETRAYRFLGMAQDGKKLPVYLSYFGAHTGRWSAGNKVNMQNLPRGGELRKSILAPQGYVLAVADSAQIEARVTAWLAGDQELLALFKSGSDVYKHMASQIYRIPMSEVTKDQRFIGKIAILGLGYGLGWPKFQHVLATGAMGPAVQLSDAECNRIVSMYRMSRSAVPRLWRDMDKMLSFMCRRIPHEFGPLKSDSECRVWLPNGLYLQYPFITGDYHEDFDEFTSIHYFDYETGIRNKLGGNVDEKEKKYIWGGTLTENVVQALARIIVAQQMLDIKNKLIDMRASPAVQRMARASGVPSGRVVTMTHDEIVVCTPEADAENVLDLMIKEMRTPPSWCADIPLNAEGGFATNYSK